MSYFLPCLCKSILVQPNVNEAPVIQESEVPNAVIDEEEEQPPKKLRKQCVKSRKY
jgi:hypothetical protein